MNNYEVKDSGARERFETGAQRDTQEGKGRPDLISPIFLERLAILLEKGARKYEDRNWEKGMPISRFLGSALRHINKYMEGHRDEDHLAAAAFNIMGAIHCEEMVRRGVLSPEIVDTPDYLRVSRVMEFFTKVRDVEGQMMLDFPEGTSNEA